MCAMVGVVYLSDQLNKSSACKRVLNIVKSSSCVLASSTMVPASILTLVSLAVELIV